ncbi:hypothetical protein [Actinomyces oricola]|uniref:hypothetical protein n=1 Tax=Actinomyces oricola TaxID=206043 RepID=UPI000FFE495F|nr:hypothetical protein [Actinomyces oricola]
MLGDESVGSVATIHHSWAVTHGPHPSTTAYCPLTQARHGAARTEFHRLLQPIPDDATDLYTRLADIAVMIPKQCATFWYRLTAIIETPWVRADHTPQSQLLAIAHQQMKTHTRPTIIGDHPNTTAPITPDLDLASRNLWLVTLDGDDPNGPDDIWSSPIVDHDTTTLTQARTLYMSMAEQINEDNPPDPDPVDGIIFWHSIQASAETPWIPETHHVDPLNLITQIHTHHP